MSVCKVQHLIQAAQFIQDAQAGYACDYCSKRQPLVFNEGKVCVEGLQRLSACHRDDLVNEMRKRHAMRIMCDPYGRSCVREVVENMNFRSYARRDDIPSAESIKTCQALSLFGRNYIDVVQCLIDRQQTVYSTVFYN